MKDRGTGTKHCTQCRKECGESMRPICYLSNACRLAVVPAVWWGVLGFGGVSGYEWLQDRMGLGTIGAAAAVALTLAAISTATLIPCGIHRRIMRRRAKCPDLSIGGGDDA